MAPIKFENDLKEKLEQRKLQPSANAWKTLQGRLDAAQSKKGNKGFWWLSIAASFVGILIVSSIFLNKEKNEFIEPTIVDIEEVQEPKPVNKADIPNKVKAPKKTSELKIQIEQKVLITKPSKNFVVQVKVETSNAIKENSIKVDVKPSFEDLKLQEVVAQAQELKETNNTVSDAEINALLEQAQKNIALYNLYNENTRKVDANALLQDVEADLEQSFRDRAFKAIKSSFNYIKTAIVERNKR